MKKVSSLLIAALVATCAFGVVAATAKENIKVESSVTIKFTDGGTTTNPYSPYAEDKFSGKVKGKKGCKKGRTVKLIKQGGGVEGKATTDDKGFYDIPANNPTGNFFAKAKKKTINKDNGDKVKCSKATSNTISVP